MKNKKIYLIALTISLVSSIITSCGSGTNYVAYTASDVLSNSNSNSNSNNNSNNNSNSNSNVVTGLGSIVGKIVDSKGQGIEGAEVKVQGISTISDSSGEYHLDKIPEGKKQLIAKYGKRTITINVTVQGDTAITPDINPIQFGNNGTAGSGSANTQLTTFKVDQDFLNQWRARGISILDGFIYVAVSDTKNLFKKGSIVKMTTESGDSWENIGDNYFVKYKIDQDVQAVAADSTAIYAVDSKGSFYVIGASTSKITSKITSVSSGPGKDLAIGKDCIYIANGSTVEKSDISGGDRTIISDLVINGGIATDSSGNLYVTSGNTIKKVNESDGKIVDVATEGIDSPIDITVDEKRGFIYVLESADIKRFDMDGKLLASFGNGSMQPVSIATDELGNVYVADEGTTYKDSKIVKFGPASTLLPGYENPDIVQNQLDSSSFYSDTTSSSAD